MPSFCAMPSELVRQHPKRNIPPHQTSIQHMLLLSLLQVPPRMPAEMGSVYRDSTCVCAHACLRLRNMRRGPLRHSREGTHAIWLSLCLHVCTRVCACVHTVIYVCVCLGTGVCVRRATLLERARALKVTRRHSGERLLAVLPACAVTDHDGGVMPLASGHLEQHVWKSKNTLPAKRARFN